MASKITKLLEQQVQAKAAGIRHGQDYTVGDELPIADIRTNGGTQARAGLNRATVDDYAAAMQAGATFPLIIVYYDGTDHWLADGFHRVAAALQIDRDTIRAEVRQGTKREAILYAVGANDTHGLRRSTADKQRAIRALLEDPEWVQWSDSAIAKLVKVDHKTVASVRAELEATGEIPSSSVRQSADGKVRDVSGIRESNASRAKPKIPDPPAPSPDDLHLAAIQQLLDQATDAGERTGTALYQEAYGHARQIGNRTARERIFNAIDRAIEGTAKQPTPLALPPELAGWRWSTNPKSGAYFLMHPTNAATFTTRHYPSPADAIAEARRWVLSQPQPKPIEQEPTVAAIDAALRSGAMDTTAQLAATQTITVTTDKGTHTLVPTRRIGDLAMHPSVSHPHAPDVAWSITYVPIGSRVGPGFPDRKTAESALQDLAVLDWSAMKDGVIPPALAARARKILARHLTTSGGAAPPPAPIARAMQIGWELSEHAAQTIETLQLEGESLEDCADRLLVNLLALALDQDNYEQHFGPQQRRQHKVKRLLDRPD